MRSKRLLQSILGKVPRDRKKNCSVLITPPPPPATISPFAVNIAVGAMNSAMRGKFWLMVPSQPKAHPWTRIGSKAQSSKRRARLSRWLARSPAMRSSNRKARRTSLQARCKMPWAAQRMRFEASKQRQCPTRSGSFLPIGSGRIHHHRCRTNEYSHSRAGSNREATRRVRGSREPRGGGFGGRASTAITRSARGSARTTNE
jgi:hypothetical protein